MLVIKSRNPHKKWSNKRTFRLANLRIEYYFAFIVDQLDRMTGGMNVGYGQRSRLCEWISFTNSKLSG